MATLYIGLYRQHNSPGAELPYLAWAAALLPQLLATALCTGWMLNFSGRVRKDKRGALREMANDGVDIWSEMTKLLPLRSRMS